MSCLSLAARAYLFLSEVSKLAATQAVVSVGQVDGARGYVCFLNNDQVAVHRYLIYLLAAGHIDDQFHNQIRQRSSRFFPVRVSMKNL